MEDVVDAIKEFIPIVTESRSIATYGVGTGKPL
jgi:hypothetical protein